MRGGASVPEANEGCQWLASHAPWPIALGAHSTSPHPRARAATAVELGFEWLSRPAVPRWRLRCLDCGAAAVEFLWNARTRLNQPLDRTHHHVRFRVDGCALSPQCRSPGSQGCTRVVRPPRLSCTQISTAVPQLKMREVGERQASKKNTVPPLCVWKRPIPESFSLSGICWKGEDTRIKP